MDKRQKSPEEIKQSIERKKEMQRLWNLRNEEKVKEIKRLWKLKNKDRVKEMQRIYRETNYFCKFVEENRKCNEEWLKRA